MPRSLDPNSFGFLITDLARLVRSDFDRRISHSGLGITPGEARILAHAARAGLVRQNALAERVGVEAMTVTGFIDKLEGKQLVRRLADPDDRRAKLIEVTDAGDEMLARVSQLALPTRAIAAEGLDPQQWEGLLQLLKTVRDNLADSRVAVAADSAA